MSPVRRSLVLLLLLGCHPQPAVRHPEAAATPAGGNGAPAPTAQAGGHAAPPAPKCTYTVRRLSAYGRGAMRPQIAAIADAFAVAWEETTDHRSIRVETFGLDAQPLGPSIEVADVSKSAAEPRLAASTDGDGFAVFWSVAHGDASTALTVRRIDRAGKPKSDAIPVVLAPGARALDAASTGTGYAVAWWNWSSTPHQLAVSFADKEGRAVGKPLPVTRAPSPDPTVDLMSGAALGKKAPTVLAWDEHIGDAEHVLIGELGRDRLEGRTDLGPGETPRFGAGVLIFERTADATLWSAPLDGASPPVKLGDGHAPAAAPRGPRTTALCYLRDTDPSEERHVDELLCGDLVDGKIADATRIAVEPRGIFGLHLAVAGDRIGVAWQAQSEDDTGVSFAALSCPDAGAKAP